MNAFLQYIKNVQKVVLPIINLIGLLNLVMKGSLLKMNPIQDIKYKTTTPLRGVEDDFK